MRVALGLLAVATIAACTVTSKPSSESDLAPRRMVVVSQVDVAVDQPPPHGAIGMSTSYRISDSAPGRTMEFRRRVLHVDAAIGEHSIDHDENYYVLGGQGEVVSDGEKRILTLGMAAYLYDGARVGIRQIGTEPLDLIISYPLKRLDPPLLVDANREPDAVIDLWPSAPPGGANVSLNETIVARQNPDGLTDRAAHDVTHPTLSIFRFQRPDGSAILIVPGGGYRWIVMDKEGFEGARWFSRQGATVYVLKHRLPHHGWEAGPDTPLQDAQRAIRIIRSRMKPDGIDPERVMVMGFSAGGHVAGSLATRFAERVSESVDAIDTLSARPDVAMLMYPVVTMKSELAHESSREHLIGSTFSQALAEKYSLEVSPPRDTPPTPIMHAADDASVPVENAILLFAALRAAGVPAALHVFEKGGHGFGLRGLDGEPRSAWPAMVMDWGRAHRIFRSP